MAIARNQPCPCGSGRKYKRCFGSPLGHSPQVDPADAQARFDLGCALLHAGQPLAALAQLRAAIRAAPQAGRAWQALADALAQLRFDVCDPQVEGELVQCLARPDVEPVYLAPAAASLLRADPSFRSLLPPVHGDRRALPLDEAVLRRLARPLFLLLLENTFIPEPDFERLVATTRRAALLAWHAGSLPSAGDVVVRELLGALAHQCFLTEYLHEEREGEAPLVDELAAGLEAALAKGGPVNEVEIALVACYRPLGALRRADTLPASNASIMGRLVLRQVREPAEEARRLFPHAGAAAVVPRRASMLIAGCGTGRHAAMCAALDPDSRILAVDLSRSSLAYAARRARESGLGNVEFAQADILELGALEERFDIIQCSGVLHHLRDPMAGARVLAGLLAPGGKMKLGLYSEIARRGVVAARRLIAERGFGGDPAGMRAARAAILALPPEDPARAVAASIDFHSLSGCRDLLFHVQESRCTLAQIAAMLGELGLEFLGFEFEFAATRLRYVGEFPLDPAATSLANWAQFEARHPDTFAAMYQFWVTPKAPARA